MLLIGFISDLHLDVNKIDIEDAIQTLIEVVRNHDLDTLILAGDMYNDFAKTQKLVADLNTELTDSAHVYYLAGNHDMARNADGGILEQIHTNYLHNDSIDIPGTDLRIIGHNGWYDYTLAPTVTTQAGEAFHHGLYFDRVVPQQESDIERTDRALQETKKLLDKAMENHKRVIFVSHFVPIIDDLHQSDDVRFQLVNAVMGSKRMGDLLQGYKNLELVVFGHQHVNPPIRYYNTVPYVNVALGNKKRRNEWLSDSFEQALEEKMYIFAK